MSIGYSNFQNKFNKSRVDRVSYVDIPRLQRIRLQNKDREKRVRLETKRRKQLQQQIQTKRKETEEEERKLFLERRKRRIFSSTKYIRKRAQKNENFRRFTGRTETLPKLIYKQEETSIPIKKIPRSKQGIILPFIKVNESENISKSAESVSKMSDFQQQSVSLKEASTYIKSFREQLEKDTNMANFELQMVTHKPKKNIERPIFPEFTSSTDVSKENQKQNWDCSKKIESKETRRRIIELRRREYNQIIQNRKKECLLKRHEVNDMEKTLEESIAMLDQQLVTVQTLPPCDETECLLSQYSKPVHMVTLKPEVNKKQEPKLPLCDSIILDGCLLEITEDKENVENNCS